MNSYKMLFAIRIHVEKYVTKKNVFSLLEMYSAVIRNFRIRRFEL